MRFLLTAMIICLVSIFIPQAMAQDHAGDRQPANSQSARPLAEKLDEMAKQSSERMPADLIRTMQAANDTVKETGIENPPNRWEIRRPTRA